MKFFTKEVKIALTGIAAIVVLFFGLQFLKGLTVFGNDYSYYVAFDDVSGLAESSPVYANGYKVGVVKDIRYSYDADGKSVAELGLDRQMHVPVGSRAEISSDLLGNIKVNLVLGKDPVHRLAPGDTITGDEERGMMAKVGEMVPALMGIMPKLDSIMTSLNMLLADPALVGTLHNVEGVTSNLNATSRELKALSSSLNSEVPSMLGKANGVMDNTQQLTARLAAIDVADMSRKVNETLANVEQMTRKLNSNEGTLGLLMRDASLYNNITAATASADSLLIDLRENPKRYVHFSLFGKKQ